MSKRVGFIGIIVEDRKKAAHQVNDLLSEHGDIIVARVGLPYPERKCSVITLIVFVLPCYSEFMWVLCMSAVTPSAISVKQSTMVHESSPSASLLR